MKVLLVEFNLRSKVLTYVKNEGTNLNSFTTTLTFVMSCEPLHCFNHLLAFVLVMLCQKQYAINEVKVGASMKKVNLKDA